MNEIISLKVEDEEIVFADLTNRENLEVVAVCKSGNIFLFDCETKSSTFFKKLPFSSIQLNLQLYSFENYVCIVQKNGTLGVIFNLSDLNYQKNLKRGDYQVEHCIFPIAFYSKENQTFLIHGTDWNRLDISCLETDELLTDRIVDYDSNSNYFDYFHSSLLVSPDAKHFTSNGWIWQPYDVITVYPIENFLKEFELSRLPFDFEDVDGYNWDRPLCWIDDKTLGISYNKKEANDGKGDFVSEIVFVDILKNEIVKRINFDGFTLTEYGSTEGELFYYAEKQYLIGLSEKSDVLITDINGNEVFRSPNLISHKYSAKHKLIYHTDNKNQKIELFNLKVI